MAILLKAYFKSRSIDLNSTESLNSQRMLFEKVQLWKSNPQSFIKAIVEIGFYKMRGDLQYEMKSMLILFILIIR